MGGGLGGVIGTPRLLHRGARGGVDRGPDHLLRWGDWACDLDPDQPLSGHPGAEGEDWGWGGG
jgi:hypothetical protein